MRRLAVMVAVSTMGLVASIATSGPTGAKVPGSNGMIAFARAVSPGSDEMVTYVANPDGSDMRQLLPGLHASNPHWSPDGTRIVVLSDGGLPCCTVAAVIVSPDTGAYRLLSMPDPTLFTACDVWSPDARRLACEGGSDSDPSRAGIYTIRTSDGKGLKRITSNPGGDDIPIDYSPNGAQIVFGRTVPSRPAGANAALFVVHVNGGGVRRITPWGYSDDDGGWSPDGTEIAFEHDGSIFVVHPDGTGLMKIAPLANGGQRFAGDVGWSPDGTKLVFILFLATAPNTFQEGIGTANADGTDVRQITVSPTFDHQPDWGSHAAT